MTESGFSVKKQNLLSPGLNLGPHELRFLYYRYATQALLTKNMCVCRRPVSLLRPQRRVGYTLLRTDMITTAVYGTSGYVSLHST